MSGVSSIEADIEALSARRQAIWAGAPCKVGEAAAIGKRIQDLYEHRRQVQAQIRAGGRTHAEIVRQARIESELERLMTR